MGGLDSISEQSFMMKASSTNDENQYRLGQRLGSQFGFGGRVKAKSLRPIT